MSSSSSSLSSSREKDRKRRLRAVDDDDDDDNGSNKGTSKKMRYYDTVYSTPTTNSDDGDETDSSTTSSPEDAKDSDYRPETSDEEVDDLSFEPEYVSAETATSSSSDDDDDDPAYQPGRWFGPKRKCIRRTPRRTAATRRGTSDRVLTVSSDDDDGSGVADDPGRGPSPESAGQRPSVTFDWTSPLLSTGMAWRILGVGSRGVPVVGGQTVAAVVNPRTTRGPFAADGATPPPDHYTGPNVVFFGGADDSVFWPDDDAFGFVTETEPTDD